MNEEEKYSPPKAETGDKAHALFKVALAGAPVVGGSAAELFAFLVTPPLERRRQKWMQEIAEGLRRLEAKGEIDFEELQSDEAFVTTVMHASQAALRNHQQEKMEALRNAVLHVAAGRGPDEALQLMFLNLVDRLTVWHLRSLKVFQTPEEYADHGNTMMGGLSTTLLAAFPELKGRRELYDQVWKEL